MYLYESGPVTILVHGGAGDVDEATWDHKYYASKAAVRAAYDDLASWIHFCLKLLSWGRVNKWTCFAEQHPYWAKQKFLSTKGTPQRDKAIFMS